MDIDLDLLKTVCRMVCRRTDSSDLFNDMQSEIYLLIYEGRYENSKRGIVSCAWKIYRDFVKHSHHVNFDDIAIYSDADVRIVKNGSGNDKTTIKHSATGKSLGRPGSKYNPALVERVYRRRYDGLLFKEIAKELGICVPWAVVQVTNTLHLPIVSTKLKLAAIVLTEKNIKTSFTNNETGACRTGEGNINAKLNNRKVLEMRKKHQAGKTMASLAKEYSVSSTVARCAIRGETWKYVSNN